MEPRVNNLPRSVRPSWLRADIDGRKTPIACGPSRRNGRMALAIDIRKHGGVLDGYVEVIATPNHDGATTRVVVKVAGNIVHDEVVAQ